MRSGLSHHLNRVQASSSPSSHASSLPRRGVSVHKQQQLQAGRSAAIVCAAAASAAAACAPSAAACARRASGLVGPRRSSPAAATGSSISSSSSLWGRRSSIVAMAAAAGGSGNDLLIIGPGVLGSYAGKLWRDAFPGATVVAQTNTAASHERLTKLGLTPRTRDQADGRRFPYVLFAAPPSGSEDYPAEVAAAARMWDGSGSMVFTSSMSVCAAEDGSEVSDENCPLVAQGKAPSTDRLLAAEQATLAAGGNVVRLVGLYHAQRGPHTFFIRQGEVARYGGYVVNMLHYEDAAGLAVAVLRGDGAPAAQGGRWKEHVFVGTDGHPLTFQEMVDACFASGVFSGSVKFTAPEPPAGAGRGKRVKNDLTRRLLNNWTPKYSSFAGFFQETKGEDFYTTSGLF